MGYKQWGSAYTVATKGSITFPIAANVKVLCTSDVNQTEVDKMDNARVVTIIKNKLTASSAEYVVNIDDIGSFWWFGIFSTK